MKIALVEDNLMFAMMIEPGLKRLGHDTRTLSGGADTLEQLRATAPDVVFVNLTSTRAGGADLVRGIRDEPALAATAVVGYAGHVERHFLQAGREAGAHMVVPNSAMRKALPQVLEKLAARLAGGPEEEFPDD